MNWLAASLLLLALVPVGVDLWVLLGMVLGFRPAAGRAANTEALPAVSVLLSVRNEAENLAICLDSLLGQHYPAQKLEVLVGNDGSEDATLAIAKAYAERYPSVRVFDIRAQAEGLVGKANVLAQLALEANGEHFLVTDGDMQMPPLWAATLVANTHGRVGMVTGSTLVAGAPMQTIEYVHAMGMLKTNADFRVLPAGMGNNMLVTREAYFATGGYPKIPFSITEDLALAQAVGQAGYDTQHLMSPEALGITQPAKGLWAVLQQRKRWMRGAMALPNAAVAALMASYMFAVFWAGLWVSAPLWALALGVAKALANTTAAIAVLARLKPKPRPMAWWHLAAFQIYNPIVLMLAVIFYFYPTKIIWKNKAYA